MEFEDIQAEIVRAQNGFCKSEGCYNKIHSIHHKLHNTSYNRKKFPLFLNSPFNLVGLCYKCHKDKSHLFRVTEKEAEFYERWLKEFKEEK